MKIVFDHISGFGKVSNQDFIYSNPQGILEPGETAAEAFDKGWILWDGFWYNLRSVRINLAQYKPNKTTEKLSRQIRYTYEVFTDKPVYRELYEQYCNYHGFKRTITWEQLFTGNVICYYHQNILVGYSTVQQYDHAFLASQFVWNYKDPKLSLGKVAQMYECQIARQELGCTHVYLLGGYEKCCLYKADYKGFEWWTGSNWSQDKTLYKTLCERDERALVQYDDI